jgi:CBS domain-containing protein
MKVSELMTADVVSCKMDHPLACAAQIMWDNDCGCVPIVDEEDHVVAMLTDRDICMAALSRGQPLHDVQVHLAATTAVICISSHATIEAAERLMQKHQLRRLPVVDRDGKLAGILSMTDIARQMERTTARASELSGDAIAHTLAAISAPRDGQRIDSL